MYCSAQMQLPADGRRPFEYATWPTVEARRFVWLPRFLPVVDRRHSLWDGKAYRYLWLRFATLRGTRFGWEAVVAEPAR